MSNVKTIGKLASLSISELMILLRLLKRKEPVVRYNLYQEVKQLIHPTLKEKPSAEDIFSDSLRAPSLSTSSFYHNLNTLEEKGLISSNKAKGKKSKIESIQATKEARMALKIIMNYFINGMIDDKTYFEKVMEEIMKKIGRVNFPTFMTIQFDEEINLNLLNIFADLTDQLFMLCDEHIFENLQKIGYEKIKHSEIFNKKVREPDDIYDIAIVPDYQRNLNFNDMSRIDVLEELKRIVMEGGIVAVLARSILPKPDNFYATSLLEEFEGPIKEKTFTKEELEQDLEQVGFKKNEVIEFHGTLIGIGWP